MLNDMKKKDPSNEHDFGRANMWKKARTKKKWRVHERRCTKCCQPNSKILNVSCASKSHEYIFYILLIKFYSFLDEILNSNADPLSKKDESPNEPLTQALGTSEYGGRLRGVGGFITPTVYFHTAKPRK